ncbi:MAG: hemolysin family protein [Candidatus Babeliaceae bacterium]|jgi:CBS domain containing-hemolysin-like protein
MEPLGDSFLINSILFCIALGFCALFSFLETSITALRLFKLKELALSSSRYQTIFQSLEKNPNRLLNTILIANNLADVTAATLGTIVMEQLFVNLPGGIGFSLAIFITTAALLIFGEVIPKNIAKAYGEKLFASTLWITNIIFYALHPFVTVLMNLADYVVYKISGEKPLAGEFITSEKEIQFLIDYINEKGLMEPDKTSMLKSIFKLGTTPVKEIMVPETSMISIRADASMAEARNYFNKYQFSRFPIYEGSLNNVIGMLHLKDVFTILSQGEGEERLVKDIVRPILFIPESIKVNQLLKEFKDQHMHIAIVINEYGGIIGLVTLEDVLEEIVGEIRDEYEAVTEKIIPLKQGSWVVDASIELDQLSELLSIPFESEDALTLGGFMTERLQHLPKKGERFTYKNFTFQVQQASEKRVFQVLIFSEGESL